MDLPLYQLAPSSVQPVPHHPHREEFPRKSHLNHQPICWWEQEVAENKVQRSTSLHWLLYHLEKEVLINAFQEPPAKLPSLIDCTVWHIHKFNILSMNFSHWDQLTGSGSHSCQKAFLPSKKGRPQVGYLLGKNVVQGNSSLVTSDLFFFLVIF